VVPRDEIPARVGAFLDTDPTVSSRTVMDALGLSSAAATRALSRLHGQRIADLLTAEPALEPAAAARLSYPKAVHRAAALYTVAELRARSARPYVHEVADVFVAEGLAVRQYVDAVHVADGAVAVAVVLAAAAPVPALVWDERWGWRTAVSRRHPLGRESEVPPVGEGIRYLGRGIPTAHQLLQAVHDPSRGLRTPADGT
jgi:hypothetical protein